MLASLEIFVTSQMVYMITVYKQLFQILIAGFALVYGNPKRLIHGYDSFGNTCGSSSNDKLPNNLNLSGISTTNKRCVDNLLQN